MKKTAVDRSGQKDRTLAGFIERMETVARTNLRSFEEHTRGLKLRNGRMRIEWRVYSDVHPTLQKPNMAHMNKVIRSINLDGETICIDVFLRPDGSYGFDEFRRDAEDGRGWYSIGHYGAASFETFDQAMAEAKAKVSWLSEAISE